MGLMVRGCAKVRQTWWAMQGWARAAFTTCGRQIFVKEEKYRIYIGGKIAIFSFVHKDKKEERMFLEINKFSRLRSYMGKL